MRTTVETIILHAPDGNRMTMVSINPKSLRGPWDGGYALDVHTVASTPIGYDSYGHMIFDTQYSTIGGLLYRLESKGDASVVADLVQGIATFWALSPRPAIDLIVPIPPTRRRTHPPVLLVATALSARLNIPLCLNCIVKVKRTAQLKDLIEYDKRMAALAGAFSVDPAQSEGKDILLFDDLYRSGATASVITNLLKQEGKARAVRLLTLTRTRSKL